MTEQLRQAAMQQALEALEGELLKMLDKPEDEQYRVRYAYLLRVITALREALAQPVQEPDRRALQAEGTHPAPCARHCEAKAFEIEIRGLKSALKQAQPEQEPVACRFCFSEKGCWTWQCYNCGEIDDVQKPPLPVQPEPLEYWNAVEGWVKIDEVREHFDAVNCGTIYKHGGEGRVPLYTTPPQRPWVGLTDEEMSDIVADMDVDFGDLLWKVICLTKIIEAKLKELNK